MAKLLPDIRIHVTRNTSQEVWEIKPLLDILQSKIEAREISERVKAITPLDLKWPPPPPQDFNGKLKVYPPTVPPVTCGTILGNLQSQQFILTCVYCSGKHLVRSPN